VKAVTPPGFLDVGNGTRRVAGVGALLLVAITTADTRMVPDPGGHEGAPRSVIGDGGGLGRLGRRSLTLNGLNSLGLDPGFL